MADVLSFPARHSGEEAADGGTTTAKDTRVVNDYAAFLRASGHSKATVRQRKYQLNRVACQLGGPLVKLTHQDLIGWLGAHPDWSAETLKACRAALVGFYRWAVSEGLMSESPAARLPTVKVPQSTPRPAPDHIVQTALGSASQRDRLMIMLAAYAGLRRGEIASLRWSNVEWSGLRITGKGGRTRVVPLAAKLKVELETELDRRNRGAWGNGWRFAIDPYSPYVFPAMQIRNPMGHMSVDKVGECLSGLLGADWTAHTLRHTFATKAYSAERDLLTVQGLLGHSMPETTARYTATPGGAAATAVDAAAGG